MAAEVGTGADPFVTGVADGMIQTIEEYLNSPRFETTRRIKALGSKENEN